MFRTVEKHSSKLEKSLEWKVSQIVTVLSNLATKYILQWNFNIGNKDMQVIFLSQKKVQKLETANYKKCD